jgi:hypothetical protein
MPARLVLALALASPGPARAAPRPLTPEAPPALDTRALTYHRERTRLGLIGMSTLTAWSLANIAGGTIGNFTTTGQARFFHQGNAAWNSVNLVLGVIGVVNAARARERPVSLTAGLTDSHRSQVAFIINTGLDVLYISTGAAMWKLGPIAPRPATQARLIGYGQALVLQGAALFAFDLAMALAHQRLRGRTSARRNLSVSLVPRLEGGAMLGLRFQR